MKKFFPSIASLVLLAIFAAGCYCSDAAQDEIQPKTLLITSFEDGTTLPLTAGENTKGEVVDTPYATDGKKAFRITEGYLAWNKANQDWSEYDFVKADFYLTGDEPVALSMELNDIESYSYFTRYNYDTILIPGKNTIKLPLNMRVGGKSRPSRILMKDKIARLVYSVHHRMGYLGNAMHRPDVYMDNVRLEADNAAKYDFEGLRAFSFGPAHTPLMGGFTNVNINTKYTSEQGYGFDSTGRRNVQLREDDAFQPDILYRSVVMLNNVDFVVDLPNGEYHVFMNIDGPNGYWGQVPIFQNRRVFANGKEVVHQTRTMQQMFDWYYRDSETEDRDGEDTFDKYIKPLFNEQEFDVKVTDGQLRLSFEHDGGLWAIPLSALVIYPVDKQKEGAKYLKNLELRRRADFEDYFRRTAHTDDNPEPTLTPAQQKQGFIVFKTDLMDTVFINTKPAQSQLTDSLSGVSVAGVYEPITFAIRAYKDLGETEVTVSDLANDKGSIPADAIKISYISNRIIRRHIDGTWYEVAPRYLMNSNKIEINKNENRWFWAVIKVPEGTPRGVYKGEFTIKCAKGKTQKLPLEFEVAYDKPLPQMDVPVGSFGAVFYIPWYGEEGGKISDQMFLRALQIAQEYGLTTFTARSTIYMNGKGKDLTLDFSKADERMKLLKEHGIKIAYINVAGLDMYGYSHFGSKVADPKNFGFDDLDTLYGTIITAIDKHAEENNWPTVVFDTSDEPHDPKQMQGNALVNNIFRKYATPRVRFAGATSMRQNSGHAKLPEHRKLVESFDIANLGYHDAWALDIIKKAGNNFSQYGGAPRWAYGPYLFMLKRNHDVQFRLGWHWNATGGNPYYGLDMREDDNCWFNLNAKFEVVTTIVFQRVYQGIVDYRMILAIEDYARQNPDTEVGKKAQALIDKTLALIPNTDYEDKDNSRVHEWRSEMIDILRQMK